MKKEVKKSAKKNVKKNNDLNYKRALIFIMIVLIIIIISLFIFIKSNKNEEGLPSLGVGNINVLNYNTDPLGLADGEHVIFIDINNPNCNNSYTRLQAMNPNTPWCDSSVFGVWGYTSPIIAGDRVLFKNGTYYGRIYVGNIGNSSTNYTIFEPYPGESVTLIFGKIYSGWENLGNGIYNITIPDMDTGTLQLQGDYLQAIKKNGYTITRANTLDDIFNLSNVNSDSSINLSDYDFVYVNSTSKQVFLRLVNITPDNVYLASDRFEIDGNSSYIEINNFTLLYGYDGIKAYSPSNHIKIINNTILSIAGAGILSGCDNLEIIGNNISYLGPPLKFDSDKWVNNNFAHAMYLYGSNGVIKNNYMSKCYSTCMHPWHQTLPYPSNFTISNNVMEGFVTNGNNIDFFNNIVYGSFTIYPNLLKIKVYNNLFFGAPYLHTNLSNSNINNNIIEGLNDDKYCLVIDQMNYTSLLMDNNLYYNCNYFRVNYTNVTYPANYFDNFNNYKTFMNSNFGLENNSFSADPLLNGTYGLLPNSPGIDNGTCITGINDDFYGNLRPIGKGCDIGPFEFNHSVCGDGVCDVGENATSCPFDCRLDWDKPIKIEYPAYGILDITVYHNDETKDLITGPSQIKDFMINNIDFTVSGWVQDLGDYLWDYTDNIASVMYGAFTEGWDSTWGNWSNVDSHEETFLHDNSLPRTKQNRILERCQETFYPVYPGQFWRSFLIDENKPIITSLPNLDGLFYDNVQTVKDMNTTEDWWRFVHNETNTVNNDGKTINVMYQMHVPDIYYKCENNITVLNSLNLQQVLSYNTTTITLKNSIASGTKVNVSYYAMTTINQTELSNWDSDMMTTLNYLKAGFGNKLVVFNGLLVQNEDHSMKFLLNTDADGAMNEAFNYVANEMIWKEQIDLLKNISTSKIFLEQSIDSSNLSENQIKKDAMFFFTSYLLGKEKYAFFNFAISPNTYSHFIYFDYWKTDIGKPLEDYHLRASINGSNVYEREFEKVLVLVNPGFNDSLINLNSNYRLLNGKIVNSYYLESESGVMLKKMNICGDSFCDSQETCSTCSIDCGNCANPNNGGNGGSGGSGGNSHLNSNKSNNYSLKNNTNVNLPLNQSTLNQSGNETVEFEKPENVVNYLVYFLMILCFIFLIIIIILLIVRYQKNNVPPTTKVVGL